MRYAVISDIHGNLPAFDAVLADAGSRGIDSFIIAGDYCLSGPFPNECIERLRELQGNVIIRGNEERYVENLIGKDQAGWTDGQMQISYWVYRNISPDNLDHLLSLPHTADLRINGTDIHIAHSSDTFIGPAELRDCGSSVLSERYRDTEVTEEMLERDVRSLLEADPGFVSSVSALEDGVYIFGHSHVQWNYKVSGRNIYLINPGSCGLPLDGIRNTLPYAILEVTDDGEVYVQSIRVPFDTEVYIDTIRASSQYREARVWSEVIIREISTAREHLMFFLQFAEKYAQSIGDDVRPFSVSTWEEAYAKWAGSASYSPKMHLTP